MNDCEGMHLLEKAIARRQREGKPTSIFHAIYIGCHEVWSRLKVYIPTSKDLD